jgi:hypothetical protein
LKRRVLSDGALAQTVKPQYFLAALLLSALPNIRTVVIKGFPGIWPIQRKHTHQGPMACRVPLRM